MSFGFTTYDSNGRESFNHNRRVLKIYEHRFIRGTSFVRNNNAGLWDDFRETETATITFSSPIKTKYPPIIFARTRGTLIVATTRYTGTNNNWTGVILGHGNIGWRWFGGSAGTAVSSNSDFEIVVCGFETQNNSTGFGLEVYDPVGGVIFNTNDKVAKLKGMGLYNWVKYFEHASSAGGSGPYRYYFRKQSGMSYGDFFQLSGLCWGGVDFGSNFYQDIHAGIFKGDINYLRYEIKGTYFGPGFDENPINYRSTMVLDGSSIPWLH